MRRHLDCLTVCAAALAQASLLERGAAKTRLGFYRSAGRGLALVRWLNLMVGFLMLMGSARGTPYLVDYEPSSGLYPEQTGWSRYIDYGGAQRSIEDGALVLDSRASMGIMDYYVKYMNGTLDPDPGETFVMQWRLRIDEMLGGTDLDVGVFSDQRWALGFNFDAGVVRSVFETGVQAPFTLGVFHDYELTSADMRSYTLLMDGEPLIAGQFRHLVTASEVGWGDDVQGSTSLSRWDYFRFGVVPEPGMCQAVLLGAGVVARRASRGR